MFSLSRWKTTNSRAPNKHLNRTLHLSMKIDTYINPELIKIPTQVYHLESEGFNGVLTAETRNDPFLPLSVAALHTSKMELITSIAVAFARTPMTLAYVAHDLQVASQGRFILGLGSQIRAHITRRFGMPWSEPAQRMKEFILALRAIWNSWYEGTRLQFRGKYYQHTLMTPFFSPTNTQFGCPQIYLAAVGPQMTEVAGEVADGLIVHPFMTEEYLRNTTLPALKRGWSKGDRNPHSFAISYPIFVVSGSRNMDTSALKQEVKKQLAFYGSTPEYLGVLESVGLEDLHQQLHHLSKQSKWQDMADLISDDVMHKFVVEATPDELAAQLKKQFGDVVTRMNFDTSLLNKSDRMQVIQQLTCSSISHFNK
ncbi:MAG: TIGR03617 family F420-dependent LLM class oxidoreductase [Gammaproteobacteria bacterium]|nr:TIGR03617 family F420-dependent LLM class oxidoreductase [Gammaproteobacteria bacterium]MYK44334.1 TIGR03617 family F420-dependent LLM class oxidoreductase [Gammaproteobacteria bacterium]